MLLVRKKGTQRYMLAGGKIEKGETPIDALIRELEEELSFTVTKEALTPLGQYEAEAANEPDYTIRSNLFLLPIEEHPFTPNAELEEVIWVDEEEAKHLPLAPMIKTHVIPEWRRFKLRNHSH